MLIITEGTRWVSSSRVLARGPSVLAPYHAAWVSVTFLPQEICQFQGNLIKPRMQLVIVALGGDVKAKPFPQTREIPHLGV